MISPIQFFSCPVSKTETLPKKLKFSIKDFPSKCDQIPSFLEQSHLLEKSLMGNFIFCTVRYREGSVAALLKKRLRHMFCCEFCEIPKSTFYTKHLWATAFVYFRIC